MRRARVATSAAAVMAVAGLLAGCAAPAPPPVRLALSNGAYDCRSKMLSVQGRTMPQTPGLAVQLQLRTDPLRRGTVAARTTTRPDGTFAIAVKEPAIALAGEPLTLVLRGGAVVDGVRVFSPRLTLPVACPPRN